LGRAPVRGGAKKIGPDECQGPKWVVLLVAPSTHGWRLPDAERQCVSDQRVGNAYRDSRSRRQHNCCFRDCV